jgi:hypothetical protein
MRRDSVKRKTRRLEQGISRSKLTFAIPLGCQRASRRALRPIPSSSIASCAGAICTCHRWLHFAEVILWQLSTRMCAYCRQIPWLRCESLGQLGRPRAAACAMRALSFDVPRSGQMLKREMRGEDDYAAALAVAIFRSWIARGATG